MDPSMLSQGEKLFSCRNRRRKYPRLRGLFFDIVDAIPALENSLCVYAGNDCTFDGILEFVIEQTKSGYKFVGGGFLMFLEYRLAPQVQLSAPFLEGNMVIIALRGEPRNSFKSAITTIFEPFEKKGWFLVGGLLIIICILVVAAAIVFTPVRSPRAILFRLLYGQDDPNDTRTANECGQQRMMERLTSRSLTVSLAVFFAVLVLLYEIAVATNVFKAPDANFTTTFASIRNDRPQKYVIISGGATEHVFISRLFAQQKNVMNSTPWSRVTTTDQMLDIILDSEHPAEYGISYDVSITFCELSRYCFQFADLSMLRIHIITQRNVGNSLAARNLCDKIVVMRLIPSFHKFVCGWYYSSNIYETERREIDAGILDLRLHDSISEMQGKYESFPLNCGSERTRISPMILVVLLLVTVFPLLMLSACLIMCSCALRVSQR